MRTPVQGGTQLLSAYSPASVIANEGPGTLYLYRSSAVSAAAYDAVIGPGGSVTWPGGEVWGFSDSTILNILNVGAGIDSGTVAITGTVVTAPVDGGGGGGGGTTPVGSEFLIRGSQSTQNTGGVATYTAAYPGNVAVGDYVFCATFKGGSTPSVPQATPNTTWTQLMSRSDGTNRTFALYLANSTAVASDTTTQVTCTSSTGITYNRALIFAITPYQPFTASDFYFGTDGINTGRVNGYGESTLQMSNSLSGRGLCLFFAVANGTGIATVDTDNVTWSAPTAGPPAPQPSWYRVRQTTGSTMDLYISTFPRRPNNGFPWEYKFYPENYCRLYAGALAF